MDKFQDGKFGLEKFFQNCYNIKVRQKKQIDLVVLQNWVYQLMVGSVLKPTVESTVIRVRFSVNPEEQVAMPADTNGQEKKRQLKRSQLVRTN